MLFRSSNSTLRSVQSPSNSRERWNNSRMREATSRAKLSVSSKSLKRFNTTKFQRLRSFTDKIQDFSDRYRCTSLNIQKWWAKSWVSDKSANNLRWNQAQYLSISKTSKKWLLPKEMKFIPRLKKLRESTPHKSNSCTNPKLNLRRSLSKRLKKSTSLTFNFKALREDSKCKSHPCNKNGQEKRAPSPNRSSLPNLAPSTLNMSRESTLPKSKTWRFNTKSSSKSIQLRSDHGNPRFLRWKEPTRLLFNKTSRREEARSRCIKSKWRSSRAKSLSFIATLSLLRPSLSRKSKKWDTPSTSRSKSSSPSMLSLRCRLPTSNFKFRDMSPLSLWSPRRALRKLRPFMLLKLLLRNRLSLKLKKIRFSKPRSPKWRKSTPLPFRNSFCKSPNLRANTLPRLRNIASCKLRFLRWRPQVLKPLSKLNLRKPLRKLRSPRPRVKLKSSNRLILHSKSNSINNWMTFSKRMPSTKAEKLNFWRERLNSNKCIRLTKKQLQLKSSWSHSKRMSLRLDSSNKLHRLTLKMLLHGASKVRELRASGELKSMPISSRVSKWRLTGSLN